MAEDDDGLDRLREEIKALDAMQAAKREQFTSHEGGKPEGDIDLLRLFRASLPDPDEIRPRQWLYGTQLLRGFITVLVAPGGTGKSTYAMVLAVALATGRKLLGEHVFHQVIAAIINLEDPLEEMDRRLAAIQLHHKIPRAELEGRIFMHSGEDRAVRMGTLGPDGFSVIHPDEKAMIQQIRSNNIGLLIVDPYAESHSLEENSNPQMIAVAAAWRRIARRTNCAILLIHHVRKGPVNDIESARGAKGLTDSARVGLLLSTMTEAEAEALDLPPEDRNAYVRLDDAKANMAPRSAQARWFHLERQNLGNGTPEYPNGDTVATVIPWNPPESVLTRTSPRDINHCLDFIAAGPQPGVLFSPGKKGGAANWAGTPIMQALAMDEKQAARQLSNWLADGTLYVEDYQHPEQRKLRKGVRVNDGRQRQ